MNDNPCTNCDCRSAEIVKAGGCPRRDPADPNFAYPDPLEPHPLMRLAELRTPVLWALAGLFVAAGVGIVAVALKAVAECLR
jgi:hypothetical protein